MDTIAASEIKILGSGLDTVILNIYLTDVEEKIIHQPLPNALQEELNLNEERAHADEVETSSYFASFKLKVFWLSFHDTGSWVKTLPCCY